MSRYIGWLSFGATNRIRVDMDTNVSKSNGLKILGRTVKCVNFQQIDSNRHQRPIGFWYASNVFTERIETEVIHNANGVSKTITMMYVFGV